MNASGWSAVVTGGGSGLGQATAAELQRRGGNVIVADLDTEASRAGAANAHATLIPADVRDEQQLAAAIAAATQAGTLRVLVTCAGVGTAGRVLGRAGPLLLKDWEYTLSVNLTGSFNALRLAAAQMAKNDPIGGDRGVIIMTASVAAYDGQVGQAAYSASKAGIAGMTLPIARDLADYAIRVVTIAPGMFNTSLLAGLPASAIASLSEQIPHPSRLGRPDEYGQLVGQIIDNHMLNGEVIRLDGALRMAPR
jgi:NAD(P)-dependent dehydrogenase (short-subunit alcohol dehydrogenase family)